MLHDVHVVIHQPGGGSARHVLTVDAKDGDDAASQGALAAQKLAHGSAAHIVGVMPSAGPGEPPPDAGLEGEDAPADGPAPTAPVGRPRRA